MKILYFITALLFLLTNSLIAQNTEVNTLLEKVHQAPNVKEKKELLEELKEQLAKKNKEAREEADAIIKAKHKIPLKIYTEQPSSK